MILKYIPALVMIGVLALSGCKTDRVAKDIAAIRKAGDAAGAREQAVSELDVDAGNLSLWRELAMSDVALSESRTSPDIVTASRYLNEAALICAAMYEFRGAKLDEKWRSVATQTAQHTVALADRVVSGVVVETARGRTRLKATPLTDIELETERFVDPDAMEKAVKFATPLILFARRLGPLVATGIAANADEMEKRIAQMGDNTNLSERLVDGRCKVYTERTTECLNAAVQDLKDKGSFQTETIFQNPIIETQ
jgi:hypothetical protein